MKMRIIISLVVTVFLTGSLLSIPYNYITKEQNAYWLHSLYLKEPFHIDNALLIDLITSPIIQRLADVYQYGLPYDHIREYSRLDHSLGVLALLIRFNAPIKEQVAGLLHDASHTAFSHCGALLFNQYEQISRSSYQDDHHIELLMQHGILPILAKHNFPRDDIDPKKSEYTALEQELNGPCGICADRLEYNLQGGLREHLLEQQDITEVLNALRFENDLWFFIDATNAKKFARISLYLPTRVWASPRHMMAEQWFTTALKRGLELKLISLDMIKLMTDKHLWPILKNIPDKTLQSLLEKVFHPDRYFTLDTQKYDHIIRSKFRGINPLIQQNNKFLRLTEIDVEFAQEYEHIKQQMGAGYCIRLLT